MSGPREQGSGVPLIALLLVLIAITTTALIMLWWLGAETANDGVDDVTASLRHTIVNNTERQVYEFLRIPFTAMEQVIRGIERNSFSIDRADGYELHPMEDGSPGCTKHLVDTCRQHPTMSGFFIGNEYGQFCSASCNAPGGDWTNWTVTTMPPIDQIKRDVPTWTIPCRYRGDCWQQYAGRGQYRGYCEDRLDPWRGQESCFLSQRECRPYWAEGRGTGARACPTESNPTSAPFQCYADLSPAHATYSYGLNAKSKPPEGDTSCDSSATGPKAPCSDMCPEFNRTYYRTDIDNSFLEYSKTRPDYDPRARGWYTPNAGNSPKYGPGSKWFTSVYICASSGVPCLSATMPIHSQVPAVGSVVVPLRGASSMRNERAEVVGHVTTDSTMHGLTVRYWDGSTTVVSPKAARLACASVATCISTNVAPGVCPAQCAADAALRGPAVVAARQSTVPRLTGVIIADYESWSLLDVLDSFKVGKTGGTFITEKNEGADLIAVSSSLPCDATRAGRAEGAKVDPQCFVKPQTDENGNIDITAAPVRVSAYESWAGGIVNGVMQGTFPNRDITSLSGPTSRVVSIGSEKFWVDVIPISPMTKPDNNPLRVQEVDWILFVVLPQRDYLLDVIEARENTLIISIVVASVVAAFLVIIALGMIAAPIKVLIMDLDEACEMKIDGILSSKPRWTPLKEIADLQVSFRVLCRHLKEYRSFLPQAVLEAQEQGTIVEAPKGTVAVVFSDIVSSTKLWESDPEAMAEALELHNQVIRKQISNYSGYEVKTIGDSFMVSFSDPKNAVQFAMAVQEKLLEAEWPESAVFDSVHPRWPMLTDEKGAVVWNGICIRIGVGYDEVQHEENPVTGRCDYRGRAVNLASRLESSAPHGAVQISARCLEAVQGSLKSVEFTKQPQQDLKGIGLVQTYLATSPGLVQRIPHFAPADKKPASKPDDAKLRRQSVRSHVSSGGKSTKSTVKKDCEARLTQFQLSAKEGSIAVVTCLDSSMSEKPSVECARVNFEINRGASAVVTCASRTQGKLVGIIGTEAHVCWNVIATCGAHPMQALIFAAHMDGGTGRGCSIGVASGTVFRGNVGSSRQRFHTVCGFPVLCASSAAAEAAQLHTSCLTAYLNQPPSSVVRMLQPVDTWALPGPQDSVDVVCVDAPVFELVRDALRDAATEGWNPSTPEASTGSSVLTARELYHEALRSGAANALGALLSSGEGAPELNRSLLEHAHALLSEAVKAHPDGCKAVRPAPFIRSEVATAAAPRRPTEQPYSQPAKNPDIGKGEEKPDADTPVGKAELANADKGDEQNRAAPGQTGQGATTPDEGAEGAGGEVADGAVAPSRPDSSMQIQDCEEAG